MAAQQLSFTLNSAGTITVSPDSLSVKEGDSIELTINRPNNSAIYCAMLFDKSSIDQDPFNCETGGSTSFSLDAGVSSTTLSISNSATIQSDSYTIVLSNSDIYLKDPTILVDDD
jgi:hypothetical protein